MFNSKEKETINKMLNTDYGKVFIDILENYILTNSSFPNQSNDGISLAILQAMQEGEMNFMRKLIGIKKGENNGK